jgi:hypothetical protein
MRPVDRQCRSQAPCFVGCIFGLPLACWGFRFGVLGIQISAGGVEMLVKAVVKKK